MKTTRWFLWLWLVLQPIRKNFWRPCEWIIAGVLKEAYTVRVILAASMCFCMSHPQSHSNWLWKIKQCIILHNEKLGGKRVQVLGVWTMSGGILVLSHLCAASSAHLCFCSRGCPPPLTTGAKKPLFIPRNGLSDLLLWLCPKFTSS